MDIFVGLEGHYQCGREGGGAFGSGESVEDLLR